VKQFGQAAIKLARTTDHSGCRVKHNQGRRIEYIREKGAQWMT